MKKVFKFFILSLAFINSLCKIQQNNLLKNVLNDEIMHDISEEVPGTSDYKKAEFEFQTTDTNQFFKYQGDNLPSSGISAFRIDFDQYSLTMEGYEVFCTNVESSIADSDLISILKQLKPAESSCIDGFRSFGYYDGIVKLDKSKPKLGIMLKSETSNQFTGRVFFRVTERVLGTDESKPMEDN